MAIALEFRDNIQFVVLEAKLTKVEEAALRLKLDQKFSQGRTLIVFKLDRFDFESPESVAAINELTVYLTNLGAFVGISGINEKQSKMLQHLSKAKCKLFATESEAKKWVLEESQKPKEAPKQRNDDEEKRNEINQLIQTYAVSFNEKDPDPHRITKLSHEYLTHPSPDLIHAIRNLIADKDKLDVEVQKKEVELAQLEQLLLDYVNVRKLPATDAEIQSHGKLSDAKSAESDKALQEINDQITAKQSRVSELKRKSDEHHQGWKVRIEKVEREILELKNKNELSLQEMKKREQEETDAIQKLRPGAS